ncbi:MAG: AtpZ/AtpI family protein [Bacteroidota bacterium]
MAGSSWQQSLREAGPYLGLGLQLAAAMTFFVLGGYGLDQWLGTLPLFLVLGALLGMVAVFAQIFRVSAELGGSSSRRPPASPSPPSGEGAGSPPEPPS